MASQLSGQQLRAIYDSHKEQDLLLNWGTSYNDLREFSSNFQESFVDAWKVSDTCMGAIVIILKSYY